MKKLFTLIALLGALSSFSQQFCGDAFTTFSPHYTAGVGMGAEVGKTGDDSPWSGYGGFCVPILRADYSGAGGKLDSLTNTLLTLYIKGAYRLARAEGLASLYLCGAGGYSVDRGVYAALSLRLLFPVGGRSALSVEPTYLPVARKATGQFSIHFRL